MHELGLLSAMVNTIRDIVQEQKIDKVHTVVLQVGELSGIVPKYLETCYPAAVYKTFLEDTTLTLEVVPGIAKCNDCHKEFNAAACDLTCPQCGGQSLVALSGRELIIKEILCE